MKKRFVFFWNPEIYYQKAFNDIARNENVVIKFGLNHKNKILRKLHEIHFSNRINLKVRLPFKKIWTTLYFKEEKQISNLVEYIFVFHGDFYWLKSLDYFGYLKKKYPNSKCVFFLTDTVKRYSEYYDGKYYGNFDISYLKNNCDLVLTYNKIDAINEGLRYYPTFYSTVNKVNYEAVTDLFFVGRAKDRLKEIHSIYESLSKLGLVCDFYITDVPKEQQLQSTNIHYNQMLSYLEVQEHIEKTRGILEIVQGNTLAFTFRFFEALLYDKNLITNNKIIFDTQYASSKKIFDVDIEKININYERFLEASKESYNYNGEYSPIHLLEYLESFEL